VVDLANFRNIKREIRIIGITNGPFIPLTLEKIDLFGIVFRGDVGLIVLLGGKWM
jgi:endonuclease V-like protein UPF0215 family